MKITKEQYYFLKGIHNETTKLAEELEGLLKVALKYMNMDDSNYDFNEVFQGVLIGSFDSQLERAKIEVVE